MVMNLRHLKPETEHRLRQYVYKNYSISKRGMICKTVDEAILFYLENIDLYKQWKKKKNNGL